MANYFSGHGCEGCATLRRGRLGLLENDGGPSEVFDLSKHRKLRGK